MKNNYKIIFVCTGNTCRSPMAAQILKDRLRKLGIRGVRVSACGIFAGEGSTEIAAIAALKNIGIIYRGSKAKGMDIDELSSADFVITMTAAQRENLKTYGLNNVYCISEFSEMGEIADPYGGTQEKYNLTAFQLSASIDALIDNLFAAD